MEIHALKLLITEHDLNAIVARALAREEQVREVQLCLLPEGVQVSGVYPTPFMSVCFETQWEVAVRAGKIAAKLVSVKALGLPVGMLRTAIMSALADAAGTSNGLQVDGDHLLFDPDHLLASHGLIARTNLTVVRCDAGLLIIECSGGLLTPP
jgi:hypothetical protein